VYFHKNKKECDFIIKRELELVDAMQVTYSLKDEATRKREIAGLIEALQQYHLDSGWILTMYEEENIIEGNYKIQVIPVWKWLLI
jgi:predicted AAA+ superfamily ATPase